ncbi:hypothetical protein RNZ50_17740 [Paracoccaceae bacterium Fryx2]|nr:hypothetical protein [Paracoccaceae bacterium Fryx2]
MGHDFRASACRKGYSFALAFTQNSGFGDFGNDWFVFRPGDGAARILDFQPGSDRICIEGPARFGDLTITRSGSDARIAYEDLVIVVDDTRPGQLKTAMFDFAEGITVDRFEAFTTGFDFMA